MTANRTIGAATIGVGLAWLTSIVAAQVATTRPGDPLPGLSAREFSEFRLGQADFLEVETPEEGLGPAFNGTSCAQCHNVPAIGGFGTILEIRAALTDSTGEYRALAQPRNSVDCYWNLSRIKTFTQSR